MITINQAQDQAQSMFGILCDAVDGFGFEVRDYGDKVAVYDGTESVVEVWTVGGDPILVAGPNDLIPEIIRDWTREGIAIVVLDILINYLVG